MVTSEYLIIFYCKKQFIVSRSLEKGNNIVCKNGKNVFSISLCYSHFYYTIKLLKYQVYNIEFTEYLLGNHNINYQLRQKIVQEF